MRIGFTGSRDGMTGQQKQTLIQELREYWTVEFHHGDCVGADAEAHAIVQILHDGQDHKPSAD